MQYRKFGNTGVNISALGFGCMRLPEIQQEDGTWIMDQPKIDEMLRHAYEQGPTCTTSRSRSCCTSCSTTTCNGKHRSSQCAAIRPNSE